MSRERELLTDLEGAARDVVATWRPSPYTAGANICRRLATILEELQRVRTPVEDRTEPDWLRDAEVRASVRGLEED